MLTPVSATAAAAAVGLGALLLERDQRRRPDRSTTPTPCRSLRGAHLQVIGAPVGGDDQVGLEVGADRLHQDMDLASLPSPLVVSPTTQRTVSPAETETSFSPGSSAMSVT